MKKDYKPIVKKFGLVTIDILEAIYFFTEQFSNAFDRSSFYSKLNQKQYSNPQIFNNLRSLVERGYIELEQSDKQFSVKLTSKGKIKLLESSQEAGVADGKWRFISFDIPEFMSRQRRQFRTSLKRTGFRQVQKSLWVCPFVKADQVDLYIEEFGVREYVAYFVSDTTDIEDYLKKLFKDKLS